MTYSMMVEKKNFFNMVLNVTDSFILKQSFLGQHPGVSKMNCLSGLSPFSKQAPSTPFPDGLWLGRKLPYSLWGRAWGSGFPQQPSWWLWRYHWLRLIFGGMLCPLLKFK